VANKNPGILRKNVILRWRKKKCLCSKCGLDPHEGDCIENWEKSDLRDKAPLTKKPNLDKRKETILNYRKKKLLCLKCGQLVHAGDCKENYEYADMRPVNDKKIDPRIVATPKNKPMTKAIEIPAETNILLEKKNDTKYNRDFIVVDIRESKEGQRIDFSCLRYLTKKYSDCIVCVLGDIEQLYPYAQVLQLRKINNIHIVSPRFGPQIIVDHLWDCNLFISYRSDYTGYCIIHEIKCVELSPKDIVKNVLMRIQK